MKYRLGCYNTDGSLERLRTVDNKESANLRSLKKHNKCVFHVKDRRTKNGFYNREYVIERKI